MEEFNAIQQAFSDLKFYHTFFSYFFAIPFILNLHTLYTYKDFPSLNKRIWYCMPLIFFLLAVALLSGINVSIIQNNFSSFRVLAMWILWFFILGGEIIRTQILKKARRTSAEAMKKYVLWCKTFYSLSLAGFLLLIGLL